MSIELLIYLAGTANGLKISLFILSVIATFGFTMLFCFEKQNSYKEDKTDLHTIAWYLKLSIGTFIFNMLIPDSNTLYAIAGAHYGKEVVQTETAQRVKHLLDLKLDELLTEAEKANARTK